MRCYLRIHFINVKEDNNYLINFVESVVNVYFYCVLIVIIMENSKVSKSNKNNYQQIFELLIVFFLLDLLANVFFILFY